MDNKPMVKNHALAVIYEVNLEVDPGVEIKFYPYWHGHIREVIEAGGFLSASVFQRRASDEGLESKNALWTCSPNIWKISWRH